MKTKQLAVTFDTNVFNPLVDKRMRKPSDVQVFEALEASIGNGEIIPFVSDVIAMIEGVRGIDRSAVHQKRGYSIKVTSYTVDSNGVVDNLETKAIQRGQPAPPLPEPLKKRIVDGREMGFKFISIPRVAHGRLEDSFYKEETPDQLRIRLDRVSPIHDALEAAGMGSAQIRELSREAIRLNPELGQYGEMGAAAHLNHPDYRELVAEWADGDAICAHYAYGHDVFCTFDEGEKAGPKSVLHKSHRQWLWSKFGIRICLPNELLGLFHKEKLR